MWIRWNELDRMVTGMDMLRARMNNLFTDFDRAYDHGYGVAGIDRTPLTNLYDQGDQLKVMAELPGMDKDDISIRIQGNYLEISGSRKSTTPKGYKAHRVERIASSFTRSFTLPYEVDMDNIEASLQNGILTIYLTKAESAKPKQITIQ